MIHRLVNNLPDNVYAFYTDRQDGCSTGQFTGLNLGLHVGDDPISVGRNRATLPFASQIQWLNQVHSADLLTITTNRLEPITADAVYTRHTGVGCVVMTADCMPLLIWDDKGQEIAAVHAGWRGLASGIIENTLSKFESPASQLNVWLGPTIKQHNFEVGEDVVLQFSPDYHHYFTEIGNHKYLFDLQATARQKLHSAGVSSISRDSRCTYDNDQLFYSYRRDGVTGRQAFGIILT